MSRRIRLVFGVHSHQPIGNFDDVIARALEQAYDPFIDALERHPAIKAVLHYSGCLCEWLERHAPGHLDRVAKLARAGRIEILTGGFYEPILSLIPRTDRVGQIRLQTRYIAQRFGVQAKGMWLAERVWEPTLPRTLREASVDYTLLDDYHFLSALDVDPVGGYYITEDQGDAARLFPISEQLRYLIPFREPAETIEWLERMAAAAPEGDTPVAVIVDDGEKFGLWPGTHAWVHGDSGRNGWLDRFFGALEQNSSWLETTTLARVVEQSPPRSRVYLPPGSYFEMGEWALPPGRAREFPAVVSEAKTQNRWEAERPFLRGGFFRNFQAKYSESLSMVRRAQLISRMLDDQGGAAPAEDCGGNPSEARRELWRAMCNCSYWHGIFGGLYLPHIRRAVGEHLCRAQRLLEAANAAGRPGQRTTARFVDIDADGCDEVEIQTGELYLIAEPARGGAISVFDLRRKDFPLGMTLTRRIEFYHAEMLKPKEAAGSADHGSIHETSVEATDALKRLVVADDRSRASAIDRFLDPSTRAIDLAGGRGLERGDFFNGAYQVELPPSGPDTRIVMTRHGSAAGRAYQVVKTIRFGARAGAFDLIHRIEPGPIRSKEVLAGALFATEFNFALVESMGRIILTDGPAAGRSLSLSETTEAGPLSGLRVEDDYAGFALNLRIQPEATIWHYPVRTVSRSEMGYEAIYQGSALLLVWGVGSTIPGETRVEIEVEYSR